MKSAIRPAKFPWFDYSRYTFSLGLDVGGRAFLSGHSASEYDAAEKRIVVRGDLEAQTITAYRKIEAILAASDLSLGDVIRVVEYVTVDGIAAYADARAVRQRALGPGVAVNTVCVRRLLRPEALIELEAVAANADAGPKAAGDGTVYLPSILPIDESGQVVEPTDLVAQTEFIYRKAGSLLSAMGLAWSNVTKTVDYITPRALADYRQTGRVRKRFLTVPYPAAAGIVMPRLASEDALIQVDFTASRHPLTAVNPGWSRYAALTYSPAIRAGDMLFMSGQAALDPETEAALFPDDVVAQAEYTYRNILRVLEAAGGGPHSLVKTVEYVTPAGLARYRETAVVRANLLTAPYPASTGIVCEQLLRPQFQLEVDPLAVLGLD